MLRQYISSGTIYEVALSGVINVRDNSRSAEPVVEVLNDDFEIGLLNDAMIAEYNTEDFYTRLIIVEPGNDILFTTDKSFEIVDMIVANSNKEINVNFASEFELSAAYPNPFNPSTTVSLTVPSADYVSVKVYNLMGQEVGVLADGMMEANVYSFTWDASNMSSGVYLSLIHI